MLINFIFPIDDSNETGKMHTKSEYVKIMMGSETDGIIKGPFESFL